MAYCDACPVQFPEILRDSLEVLFLNDNQLECVPPTVCGLKNLSELYLSNNPGIQDLPVELGQLSNLWQLDIEELNISNVPADVRKDGPAAVLAFLRAELRRAEACRLLKLMVVGPPRQGKSALLEGLQTGRSSSFLSSERSVRTSTWELERPSGVKTGVESVSFNVWDIGGPASMSTVNQCFFTDKALYVVIWNLALGEEAVANLQSWLLNIEARAPNSAVVVVGTHLDLIDTKFRTERIATLRAYILALCRTPSGARASGYPDITWKHLHEVSCKTLEGMDGLRRLLYQVACSMKDISNPASCHKLVGRLKKEAEKKQKDRGKMGDKKEDDVEDRPSYDDMLASMKVGFDSVAKQIGSNSEENRKEMKDIQESIQNLGSMLRQELATFKDEIGKRFETIDTVMEAQGRDIKDLQDRVVETEEWNADLKEILASSLKQQRKIQEKVTDLEWRSRRNNIRVWGVPEGTEKDSTHEFIERLLREHLKITEDVNLQIQRAHRVMAPRSARNKNPRAIIVNFLKFQQKEDILKKAWLTKIEIEGKRVTFDHDYPAEVAAKRRDYAGLKRVLKEGGIRFQSPRTALKIHWQGGVQTYDSPQEAAQAMKEKGLQVDRLVGEQPMSPEEQLEAAFKWRRVGDEGTSIPKSYLMLQEAVLAEQQRRDSVDEVQYLTDLELDQIIELSPGSDIKDYEDLQTGPPQDHHRAGMMWVVDHSQHRSDTGVVVVC
ncbi:hypothetical protein NFI96_008640 [Prochilodus magdalenae]|nr:hypothetical protein NFI96_008640 [Prochilodus magdalenae]